MPIKKINNNYIEVNKNKKKNKNKNLKKYKVFNYSYYPSLSVKDIEIEKLRENNIDLIKNNNNQYNNKEDQAIIISTLEA